MKITISLTYHTNWGESLYISGSIPQLGSGDPHKALEMLLVAPDTWQITLNMTHLPGDFDYSFIMKAPERAWRFEWGAPHRFRQGEGIDVYSIFDHWHDLPEDKPFYSSAFVDGMLNRKHRDCPLPQVPDTISLRVEAPMVAPDEVVAICGEGDLLGNWDPSKAPLLNDAHYPLWEINLPLDKAVVPFSYKFIIVKKDNRELVGWEYTPNRIFGISQEYPNQQIVIDGIRMANPKEHWKGAGTAIPVFSIRTEEDFGVGDFIDIKKMIDWCRVTNQKVLQILPINDTTMTGTWLDSYPYKANSTFALHPMFMRLEMVGIPADENKRKYFESLRQELNALTEIDYERVNNAKSEYLHEIFAQIFDEIRIQDSYREFVRDNEYWLLPYTAWSVLRDINGTPDNNLWGEYARYDKEAVTHLREANTDKFDYYYFVQYHLDRQLREVRDYAHANGVVLKGDIPIGISRFSVDAWTSPELFNMDMQAGAPPDDFSVLGQNWGFPTYNWDVMARDGFQWWKNRFRKMAEYFDAYRVDHILGFFRIWQIPVNAVHGLLGYFNPALPYSPEELRHNYDFNLNVDLQTKPLILEWMLMEFFGEYTDEVKGLYLEWIGGDRYRLREFVNTQAKVEAYFDTLEKSEKNILIRESIYKLIDDVLFIEDPYEPGRYHPRISAQSTYQYRILSDYEKWSFNRLYNDFFYHRNNEFWRGKALWKLPPLLDATRMLCCAEDLGMIPDCVPDVMHTLRILSLEIQRMPKNPSHRFGDTWNYPYYSVCTTSTHDMSGIRGWWEEDRATANDYYHQVLHESGDAPAQAEPWICDKIVELQLKSPSMLCILPLQDWLSTDADLRRENPLEEQINVPANPRHYWRYRMHLTVEDLLNARLFNSALLSRIQNSGR